MYKYKIVVYTSCFVLVLGLVLVRAADAADPGLAGWWKFDEGSGTTVLDSSGYDNHGTFVSNPQWAIGHLGGALSFDGVDDYVEIQDAEELTPENFTIAFWVNPVDMDRVQITIAKKTQTNVGGYSFNITSLAVGSRHWVNINGAWVNVTFSYTQGVWQHVAVTYDGTNIKGHLNGELKATTEAPGSLDKDSGVLRIGAEPRDTVSAYYNGSLDDVQIYNRALTEAEIQLVMKGVLMPPALASKPSPADGATDVPRDVTLSWSPGNYAPAVNGHKIFLSENFNDVNDGVGGIIQDSNIYTPAELLKFDQTYYWRVDEANNITGWDRGEVWHFTVEPFAYPLTGDNIKATASSMAPDKEPENTINGSGLDDSGLLHGKAGDGTMWLTNLTGVTPAWIEYEFDKIYKLHEMWVWNYNDSVEPMIGFGFKDVSIEYSVNGVDYQTLGTTHEFARAPGESNYAPNTFVDFGGVPAKYIKLTAKSNWGGILDQYGLSEVRFFHIPVYATEPDPDSEATDISIGTIDNLTDVTLGFRAGREAAKHEVYLSTDEQAVIDGTAAVTTVTETSYGPLSLDLGKTYYWRVDEVNQAETPATWPSDIWNFTTQEFFIVDDFEDYNDYPSREIYTTWVDGYDDPANGSTVGHLTPPSVETTIVHSGKQSMPFRYDNSSASYSEATMTLASGRDWTVRGVGALSLWFRGHPESVGSFSEAPAGTYTMTASGADIWGASDQFHFAYKQLTGPGSIVAKVESIQNTNAWAKAGVMIRDTLDPDSVHAMMVVTPAQGVSFERRRIAGENTVRTNKGGIAAPQWVKIERDISGNVSAFYSADGSSWMQLGVGGELLTMNTPMYIGLALTAHNTDATCEAKFSGVQIVGAAGPQWSNQDIGILNNDPEQMYVALSNSGGTPAVVYHPDPNATQAGTWTEWNINLDKLRAQGIDLTNVDKLSIGFGDRTNPLPGGSGVVYFDDVRLYPYTDYIGPLLSAWYTLDDNVADSSGNGNDGILSGDPTWVDGKIGRALQFDGIDDYVEVQDAESLTPETFTIAFWINPVDMDRVQITIAKRAGSIGSYSFNITSLAVGSRHWIRINGAWVNVTFSYTQGVWQHVTVTYDGTTIKGHLNGELMATTEAPGSLDNDSGVLRLGADPRDTVSSYYNGSLDDVRIYDKALSQDEIASIMDGI